MAFDRGSVRAHGADDGLQEGFCVDNFVDLEFLDMDGFGLTQRDGWSEEDVMDVVNFDSEELEVALHPQFTFLQVGVSRMCV